MTYRNDDQSFENTLDNAVRNMHQEMPRGNQPSNRAWRLLAEQAGISDQHTVRAQNHPGDAEKFRSNPREAQAGASYRTGSHLGWSTWLTAAVVLLLIGASVNFLMPEGNDGGNVREHSIALAPGTPDVSQLDPMSDSTPSATPDLYTPVHGPEFVCEAEPLTEEQVYRIVLNPGNGYYPNEASSSPDRSGLWESPNHWMNKERERRESENYIATDEPRLAESITETANAFWNCLMNGSALQVWSMMEPSAVQHEILTQYPVLRDEETLRRHIRVWGPRRYSASIYHVFPDLGNVDSYQASMRVVEGYGAIRIGYTGDDPWKALVLMQSHPESSTYQERYLLLQIAPSGEWWVSMIFYE